jgi:hypothetical protein
MTVDDVRKKKSELELELLAKVSQFEQDTKTTIGKIDLTHANALGGAIRTVQLGLEVTI